MNSIDQKFKLCLIFRLPPQIVEQGIGVCIVQVFTVNINAKYYAQVCGRKTRILQRVSNMEIYPFLIWNWCGGGSSRKTRRPGCFDACGTGR